MTDLALGPRAATHEDAATDSFQLRLEVPFGPRWQHVELLRMSILQCLATLFGNHDFCDQLGMVTAELVENAIHYGHWENRARYPFRLSVRGSLDEVVIEVVNPIDPLGQSGERLSRILERLRAASSAKEAYLQRMREIADGAGTTGSGLGLLRVAYETNCKLEAWIEDRSVCVVATITGHAEQ